MKNNAAHRQSMRQHGLTLIELIMFIVILSVGVVGLLGVMNSTIKHSADPMIRKQALAIAESLLEEIELQPFTFCDPNDPAAITATSKASCAKAQEIGPTPAWSYVEQPSGLTRSFNAETRYSAADPFDNVGDYGSGTSGTTGFTMNGIRDLTNTAIGRLENYNATVTLTEQAIGGVAAADVLRIDVTVTPPGGENITLTGYRFRYAPRAVP